MFTVRAENTEYRTIQGCNDTRTKILKVPWRYHKHLRLGLEGREAKVCVCACGAITKMEVVAGHGGWVEAKDRRSL